MTELTLAQACNETRQFGRMLKGMARLVEVADALESADQAIADRRRQEAETLARIASAQTQLEAIEARATAAAEAAPGITAAAEAKAAEMLAAARTQIDEMLTAARTDEATVRDNSKSVIARANAAERRLKAAQDELVGVETKLELAKAEGRKIFQS